MNASMDSGERRAWGLAGLVFVLVFGGFALRTELLNAGRDGIVRAPDTLQAPYGARELYDALAPATPAGRRLYAWSELTLDALFPPAVAALLSLLLAGAWTPPARAAWAWRVVARGVPWLGAAADYVENVTLWRAASHPQWDAAGASPETIRAALEPLARVASAAGGVKWGAAGTALLLLLLALLGAGRLGRIASLLWLARGPLVGLVGLVALALLGRGDLALPTLPNMLVLESFVGLTVVAFVAAYTAALSGFHLALIWELAPLRTGAVLPRRPVWLSALPSGSARQGRYFMVCALPLVFLCAVRTGLESTARLPAWQVGLAPLAGVGLCWLAFDLVEALRRRLTPFVRRFAAGLSGGLARVTGPGYYADDGRTLLPGHGLATAAGVVGLGVYFVGQWALAPERPFPDSRAVPTLAYVLAALAVCVSLLSGVTFFFDRWRVPFVGVALVVLAVVGRGANGHVFGGEWRAAPLPSVRAAARARLGTAPPFVTVVSASGGGIQAAAWTARVLTGLQEAQPELTRRLGLISATSGGSVGAYFFLSAFDAGGGASSDRLRDVTQAAASSALEHTAWGLVYPDLQHALGVAGRSVHDRGWALERGWLAARAEHRLGDGRAERWTSWVARTRAGLLPAVVFNSIRIDDGLPLRFATVRHERSQGFGYGPEEAGYLDLDTVTAARLSATFPYVSPLARPLTCGASGAAACWAAADGGYLDNDATLAVLAWLRDFAGGDDGAPAVPVLWLQIDGFPSAAPAEPVESGWTLSLFGPLQGLLRARTRGQPHRRDEEIALLRDAFGARLEVVRLSPPQGRPRRAPLSWQLGGRDVEALESDWRALCDTGVLERLGAFVQRTLAPVP